MELIDGEKKIKIVLADDHEIVRAGIRRLLSIDKGLHIVDEAANGEDAIHLVKYHKPDIAILDILMPKMNGIEATEKLKRSEPGILVVILTAYEDYNHIERALAAGADGYLSKDVTAKELVESLRIIMTGQRVLSRSIIRTLQKKFIADNKEEESPVIISNREQEILNYVAMGRTSLEIAGVLNISIRTVESHRYNLMQKLGAKNTAALVRYAILNRDLNTEET